MHPGGLYWPPPHPKIGALLHQDERAWYKMDSQPAEDSLTHYFSLTHLFPFTSATYYHASLHLTRRHRCPYRSICLCGDNHEDGAWAHQLRTFRSRTPSFATEEAIHSFPRRLCVHAFHAELCSHLTDASTSCSFVQALR